MFCSHTDFINSASLVVAPGYSSSPYDRRNLSNKAQKFFKNPYVRVPNALIRGTNIISDPHVKITFLTLAAQWACAGTKAFAIDRKRIHHYTHFHPDTISKHLGFLRARGLITTKKTASGYLEIDVPILRVRTENLPKEYSEQLEHGHYFTSVPLAYILNFLSAAPKLLLIIVKTISIGYSRKEVYFPMKQFEEYSSFSRRTISRYLKYLKSISLLEVKSRKLRWNHYIISCDKLEFESTPEREEKTKQALLEAEALKRRLEFFKKWK